VHLITQAQIMVTLSRRPCCRALHTDCIKACHQRCHVRLSAGCSLWITAWQLLPISPKTTVEKGGQQPKQTFTDQFHRAEYDFAHYNLNLWPQSRNL